MYKLWVWVCLCVFVYSEYIASENKEMGKKTHNVLLYGCSKTHAWKPRAYIQIRTSLYREDYDIMEFGLWTASPVYNLIGLTFLVHSQHLFEFCFWVRDNRVVPGIFSGVHPYWSPTQYLRRPQPLLSDQCWKYLLFLKSPYLFKNL